VLQSSPWRTLPASPLGRRRFSMHRAPAVEMSW